MAKNKSSEKATEAPAAKTSVITMRKDTVRETVESVVIAFVLAFLFRTFEAEAFVIPTGSMAPTLMGRHKDLVCEECGFPFRVSASEEVDQESGALIVDRAGKPTRLVQACTCPNCRHTMKVGKPDGFMDDYPSHTGDRIMVVKFPYEFAEPKRWDVIVFKYPEESQINFIKRLIGLPNESLRITHGDIYTRPKVSGSEGAAERPDFHIERKPPEKARAMLQMVNDNRHPSPTLAKAGWPRSWTAPAVVASADGQWQSADGQVFKSDGSAAQDAWIRYQHFPPTYEDWRNIGGAVAQSPRAKNPQLISDFTSYNTNYPSQHSHFQSPPPVAEVLGQHWVGDLAIECDVTSASDTGEIVLELVEGGKRFQCRFNLATGEAVLGIDGLESYRPVAATDLRGKGAHEVLFANVDDELLLWVDGSLVKFNAPTTYEGVDTTQPATADLAPVGVASRGAALSVTNLRVLRDVYYIAAGQRGEMSDYPMYLLSSFRNVAGLSAKSEAEKLAYLMSTPGEWHRFEGRRDREFQLSADQFLVLGDNSGRSKDSRLWDAPRDTRPAHVVTRDLLIGKALFIYWPHSWNQLPGTEIPFPYFPNFADMGFVR